MRSLHAAGIALPVARSRDTLARSGSLRWCIYPGVLQPLFVPLLGYRSVVDASHGGEGTGATSRSNQFRVVNTGRHPS